MQVGYNLHFFEVFWSCVGNELLKYLSLFKTQHHGIFCAELSIHSHDLINGKYLVSAHWIHSAYFSISS